eukprot:3937163-Prymnesium_polylepis.1
MAPLWTNVGPSAIDNVVPLIADHASVLRADGKILTYGGLVHAFSDSLTYEAARISSLFEFDPSTLTTVEIVTVGETPIVRAYHTLIADGAGRAFAFGGKCGTETYCGDLWLLELGSANWTALYPATASPAARYAHAAAWHGGRMWISGGSTTSGPVADLWSFDPTTTTWQELG